MKRHAQGFTLLELLMVVIIIGILAAVAIPQYLKSAEKARMAEAVTVLGSVRNSQVRFYAEQPATGFTATIANLDFDPSALGSFSGTPVYTYACAGGGAAFTCSATRGAAPVLTGTGCVGSYKVTVNQLGAITGRNCQVP